MYPSMHWAGGCSRPPLGRHPPGRHPPSDISPSDAPLGRHPMPSACSDIHPPAQYLLEYTPPAQWMLGYTQPHPVDAGIHTTPPSACWDTPSPPPLPTDGHCSKLYASYWNPFLLWFGFYGFCNLTSFGRSPLSQPRFAKHSIERCKKGDLLRMFTFSKTFVQTTRGNDKFKRLSMSSKNNSLTDLKIDSCQRPENTTLQSNCLSEVCPKYLIEKRLLDVKFVFFSKKIQQKTENKSKECRSIEIRHSLTRV